MSMAPFVRNELIGRADEIVKFSKTVFSQKRSELLRSAAKLYKEATLTLLAEKIEKEADDWDIWIG